METPYAPPQTPAQVPERISPRRWWLAGLLGLFTVGLGHVYVGRAAKGFVGFVLRHGLSLLAGAALVWGPWPRLALLLFLLPLGVYVYFLVDAMVTARRSREYRLKRYNRWYVYLLVFVAAYGITSLAAVLVRSDFAQTFHIPSNSLEPTILPGDHLTVDKRAYHARDPERGDLVMFESIEQPGVLVIKRAVGLPGDHLEIRGKRLFINGKVQTEPYVQHGDPVVYSASTFNEQMRLRDNQAVTVPEASYFLLGDNRDFSYDSRFFGAVPRERILGGGRMVVYWSRDPDSGDVRWERIGKVLE
jgi:signal peptidase I